MNHRTNSTRGLSIASVIVATVLLGVTAVGVVQYAASVGQTRRDMDTRVQEDSYRVFQSELALSGSNPTTMTANPLTGVATASSPDPTVAMVGSAGSDFAGSASVSAYSASSDTSGRSGALGFRINSTGTAVPAPVGVPLQPPSFRVSGVVPESEFAPNLIDLILADPSNPPGTVYRYTTDGSDPTDSSPIWTSTSGLPAYPLPSLVKSAAFNADPSYTTSPIVSAALARNVDITYSRAGGGAATGFTYAEVTGGTNGIVLSIATPPGDTVIYYTYDGSEPTTSSDVYSGAFHVPLPSWSSSVTLRAIAVSAAPNITFAPLTTVLTPIAVPMPAPSFGTPAGSTTAVEVPVTAVVPGALIRYDIDQGVTGSSPTISSGDSVTVTAPSS